MPSHASTDLWSHLRSGTSFGGGQRSPPLVAVALPEIWWEAKRFISSGWAWIRPPWKKLKWRPCFHLWISPSSASKSPFYLFSLFNPIILQGLNQAYSIRWQQHNKIKDIAPSTFRTVFSRSQKCKNINLKKKQRRNKDTCNETAKKIKRENTRDTAGLKSWEVWRNHKSAIKINYWCLANLSGPTIISYNYWLIRKRLTSATFIARELKTKNRKFIRFA